MVSLIPARHRATTPPRHRATAQLEESSRGGALEIDIDAILEENHVNLDPQNDRKRYIVCVGGGRRKEGPRQSPTPDCAVLLCRFSLRFEKESKSEIERRKRISRQPLRHLDPVSWTQLQPLLAFLVPMAFFLVHSYGRM